MPMTLGMPSLGMAEGAHTLGVIWSRAQLEAFMATQADGFWFDFSKTDRHFQEANGPTLADNVGEAIGLALDQRGWGGLTLAQVIAAATEKLPSTDFSAATGWTTDAEWAISGGKLNANYDTSPTFKYASALGPGDFVTGAVYLVEFDWTRVSGALTVYVRGANVTAVQSGSSGHFSAYMVAGNSGLTGFRFGSSAFNGTIDNVSCKLIPGKYGQQATGTLKGVRQAAGNKFDGSDDNLLTNYFAGMTLGSEGLVPGSWSMSVAGGTSTATESPAGTLNLTGDGTNAANGQQSFATVVGRTYAIEADVVGQTAFVTAGSSLGGTQALGATTLAVGTDRRVYFVAVSTTTYIRIARIAAGLSTVSNISCKEVTEQSNFIVAKVTVPASLATTRWFMGSYDGGNGRFVLGFNTSGQVVGAVGAHSEVTIKGTVNHLGGTAIVGLSFDGSTVRLFDGDTIAYEGAQSGAPNTAIPARIGSLNNNGTAGSFFGGAVEEILAGREFLSLTRFKEIAAHL